MSPIATYPTQFPVAAPPPNLPHPQETQLEAAIVGAGFSGIASACRLQRDLGLQNFRLFDRASPHEGESTKGGFGGTWRWNLYPGAKCDVPGKIYSLSFEQREWPEFYPKQEIIRDYLEEVATKYDLHSRTKFETEVTEALWIEGKAHWVVTSRNIRTNEYTIQTARVLISCVGGLSTPQPINIAGAEDFEGPLFHSSRWNPDTDLNGKNVIVIGNGCTAAQIVPAIADKVKKVTQVIRSKHHYIPRRPAVFASPRIRHLEATVPGFRTFTRWALTALVEINFLQAFQKDGQIARDRFAQMSAGYIRKFAPKKYHEMLIPNPGEVLPTCKRAVLDDGYIPTLNRDNVELTNDGIVRINKNSVTLKSGREIPADIIVFATGFQMTKFCGDLNARNGQGESIAERWKADGPSAYRGCQMNGFENFFIMMGPGTVAGYTSVLMAIEACVEQMTTIIRPLFLAGDKSLTPVQRSNGRSVNVTVEAEERDRSSQRYLLSTLTYSRCGMSAGDTRSTKVIALAPTFQSVFSWRTRFPSANDFVYKGISHGQAVRNWKLTKRLGSLFAIGGVPTTTNADSWVTKLQERFAGNFIRLVALTARTIFAGEKKANQQTAAKNIDLKIKQA